MNFDDVSRDNVIAAIEEYDRIGQEAFHQKYGYGAATTYLLVHEGRKYDSKAILGVAYGHVSPDHSPPLFDKFSGGATQVVPYLEKLGFKVEKKPRNPDWSRDELILCLDFYLKHPGETHDPKNPKIVELSGFINSIARALGAERSDTLRNPIGVSMKLMNFRAHDPAYQSRGQVGLSRGNKLEPELWAEFAQDQDRLSKVAENILEAVKVVDEADQTIKA